MTESAPEPVLKRKASAGRTVSAGSTVTPAKALGQCLARTAQDMLQLPLRIAEAGEERMTLAEIPECLPDRALLAMLEGPGEGLGLAALSPETMATLIEMQTTGRVGSGTVTPRKPTRTDAAMSVQFIDRVLEELQLMLSNDPAIRWVGGFRYASYLDDPRPLGLLLEDTEFRVLRMTIDFGADWARQGKLLLALPAEGRGSTPARPADGAAVGSDTDRATACAATEWEERIEAAVCNARTLLYGVLERVQMPLAELLALRPGAMIELSKNAVAQLRVEGRGNRLIASGKLGQCQGNLAVRLHPTVEQEDAEILVLDSDASPPGSGPTLANAPLPNVPGPDAPVDSPATSDAYPGDETPFASDP